ncbi:type II toxin-antitoxin system VapC family toxin [Caballeronia sordidicola]|uniref:type II toxin-antitoxin system VapC family toxin n=1 Tax=Caballeronia sordidicola TaxID=196367 RepID=UPI0004CFF12C|nr:type II toxin-antitoxin system VapC family toxin [Caballeronia sordidicola]
MRLLLDSHIFLWAVQGDGKKLTRQMRKHIVDADEVFVSAASTWELSVKVVAGKLVLDVARFASMIERTGFRELPVVSAHAVASCSLPPLHKDPFDRLLIGQALYENMEFLTADTLLRGYSPLVTVV